MRFLLLTILITSCSTSNNGVQKKDLDQLYIGSGIEKYYLPDLPTWANFSQSAQCKQETSIRYINFRDMHLSYAMNYEQLVQYQLMLNRKFEMYKKSTGRKTIFLKDESFITFNVHQQIVGGGRDFLIPKFNKIHLVWIDDAIKNSIKLESLRKLMKSEKMSKGHPIFVSMCLSSFEMEEFINNNGFSNIGVKGISQSMFSPYDSKLEMDFLFSIDVHELFKGKDIVLFGTKETASIKGYKKFIKY